MAAERMRFTRSASRCSGRQLGRWRQDGRDVARTCDRARLQKLLATATPATATPAKAPTRAASLSALAPLPTYAAERAGASAHRKVPRRIGVKLRRSCAHLGRHSDVGGRAKALRMASDTLLPPLKTHFTEWVPEHARVRDAGLEAWRG
eukprot:365289-Chlamydomonas_euryale.AAC.20